MESGYLIAFHPLKNNICHVTYVMNEGHWIDVASNILNRNEFSQESFLFHPAQRYMYPHKSKNRVSVGSGDDLRQFGLKPSPEPLLAYHNSDHLE